MSVWQKGEEVKPTRVLQVFLSLALLAAGAEASVAPLARGPAQTPPWRLFDRRVGLFVHWGIYAVDGYHEQQRMRLRMPRAEYEKRAASFTAEKFDAAALVAAAQSLGAEYLVFTAKHHDGFCLWDTKMTDFSVMNTPAGRDVLAELAAACRRHGLRLGLYYSNPDWHHPNAHNPLSTHQVPPEPGDVPDMAAYKAYVKAQVTELLSNYGDIVCLFWDIPTKIPAREMNELVRKLQPGILVNDRGWGDGGDYSTPERNIPEGMAFTNLTEACDSVGAQSWGYRANEDYRTAAYVARSIDRMLAKGGNYLLNVGPKADGTIPGPALDVLRAAGDWYRTVRESYRGCVTDERLSGDNGVLVTRRGDTVYLHYPDGVSATGVSVFPAGRLPRRARVLGSDAALSSELAVLPRDWQTGRQSLHVFGIPAECRTGMPLVIRLDFEGALE